jgi:hypothetical protein
MFASKYRTMSQIQDLKGDVQFSEGLKRSQRRPAATKPLIQAPG